MTKFLYWQVGLACSGLTGGIVHDALDDADAVKDAQKVLQDLGISYVHAYYWPGDFYYAFVRVEDTQEGMAQISALTEHIVSLGPLDSNYITHRGITVEEEFQDLQSAPDQP